MIINIPIEKYEERYTEQWSRWFPDSYKELGLSFIDIQGDTLTDKILNGQVLDYYGTNYFKFSQLMKLIEMIRNNEITDSDILFFHDLWFPGIEALQYIRNMSGKKFAIWGILHAGTWDNNDFTYKSGMRNWAKYLEMSWLQFFDRVFVGSNYHKELILKKNKGIKTEIIVSGLPFKASEVARKSEKENIVVFPHRLDSEKQPQLFDRMKKILEKKYPDWKFVKTKDITKTKEAYFQLLGKAKIAVSFAKQETFGYAMLESVANGCIPIVPNDLSYASMPIYNGFRYQDFNDAVNMVSRHIRDYKQTQIDLSCYEPKNVIKDIFL